MSGPHAGSGRRPQVVVVGGGFGGLAAVRGLRHADVDVTLIDRNTYNTFQPLLYQVATSTLNPGDVTWFLRAIRTRQDNAHVIQAVVDGIDTAARVVHLGGGGQVRYDYLVLAVGVTANYFGTPGAERNALPLYTRAQALTLRDRIVASMEGNAIDGPGREVRIVVVGGGPTGVETAGALAETRNKDVPVTYPELDPARVHVTLIEKAPHLLAPFTPASRSYAANALRRRGVDLRLNTAVSEVLPDGVVTDPGGHIAAGIVVWASGITAHAGIAGWGLPQGPGGRIRVDDQLRVLGHDRVFAVGDAAAGDPPLPQLAQPALQAGRHAAAAIVADLAGTRTAPFRYKDKGILATVGRAAAVAEIAHLPPLRGLPAWTVWNAVHIATLLGGRNRAATMVNLGIKYLAWGRTHNAITGDTPPPARPGAPPR